MTYLTIVDKAVYIVYEHRFQVYYLQGKLAMDSKLYYEYVPSFYIIIPNMSDERYAYDNIMRKASIA